MKNRKKALLFWHMGLGDAIICQGILRKLAAKDEFQWHVPVYPQNLLSVAQMVVDMANENRVRTFPVHPGTEETLKTWKVPQLKLGCWRETSWDPSHFVEEFYAQAGVDLEESWRSFKFDDNKEFHALPFKEPYAIFHEDHARNFRIRTELLPQGMFCFPPIYTNTIFANVPLLQNATEIHCIDSSFLHLVDRIPTPKAQRLVLHAYARDVVPLLKKKWEILT